MTWACSAEIGDCGRQMGAAREVGVFHGSVLQGHICVRALSETQATLVADKWFVYENDVVCRGAT